MKRRRLSAEDQELWERVTARTERMRKSDLEAARFDPDVGMPTPVSRPDAKTLKRSKAALLGKPEGRQAAPGHNLAPSVSDQLRRAPVQMDAKAYGKLKRGKLRPEGKLDLHGMTLDRAHPMLTGFVMKAHAQGKRLVLVVTGKGKHRDDGGPIPVRLGVLRHQVPQWLQTPPLKSVVLQVTPAHISHGGGGAYYVYLRRQR
ncbi:Smr/MutS family protein [Sulfitobacter albidus]|uniref:Smr/MutS family protein n=1 Tax=Sulfitobacter albidus TaxID=2829501 RepID=A0A975JCY3_9RHOB|nr:Smr/MutS family protein [Sulfitobacter albidus]QUJ76171.1 Smr/MutS family protein [Sulfitobacter albidus]